MPAEVAGLRARTVRQDYLIAELRHALYGKRSGPLDPGALVRHGGLPSGPGRQPDAGASQAIKPALHGRDPRPGTLTGPGKTRAGQNQGRLSLWALTRNDRGWGGEYPPAAVFTHAPGHRGSPAMDMPHVALTASCRSTVTPGMTPWPNPGASAHRRQAPDAGLLPGPRTPQTARHLPERRRRDRSRDRSRDRRPGPAPHRGNLQDRGQNPRQHPRRAPRCPARPICSAGRRLPPLADHATQPYLCQIPSGREAQPYPPAPGRPANLPDRWPRRDGQQPCRKHNPVDNTTLPKTQPCR